MILKPDQTQIFYWNHQRGMSSQCLVRLYILPSELLFITSELQQNRHIDDTGCGKINGLGSDFVNLANLIWKHYFSNPPVISFREKWESDDSLPLQVTWLQHYGSFSDWDTHESESFTQVMLRFERDRGFFSDGKNQRYPNEKIFTAEQVKSLHDLVYIEDIETILREEAESKPLSISKSHPQAASFNQKQGSGLLNLFVKQVRIFAMYVNNSFDQKDVSNNDKSVR